MHKVKEHELSKSTTPKTLKRSPLPTTVVWNGQGSSLETFISAIEGHVDQQTYMSYILLPSIAHWWLQYGVPSTVIIIATEK